MLSMLSLTIFHTLLVVHPSGVGGVLDMLGLKMSVCPLPMGSCLGDIIRKAGQGIGSRIASQHIVLVSTLRMCC